MVGGTGIEPVALRCETGVGGSQINDMRDGGQAQQSLGVTRCHSMSRNVIFGVSQNCPSRHRFDTKPRRCSAAKDGVDAGQDKLQAPRGDLTHALCELLLVEGHDEGDVRDRILR
jgi:hypothetical protein